VSWLGLVLGQPWAWRPIGSWVGFEARDIWTRKWPPIAWAWCGEETMSCHTEEHWERVEGTQGDKVTLYYVYVHMILMNNASLLCL
jgi:hypothetical protein